MIQFAFKWILQTSFQLGKLSLLQGATFASHTEHSVDPHQCCVIHQILNPLPSPLEGLSRSIWTS